MFGEVDAGLALLSIGEVDDHGEGTSIDRAHAPLWPPDGHDEGPGEHLDRGETVWQGVGDTGPAGAIHDLFGLQPRPERHSDEQ